MNISGNKAENVTIAYLGGGSRGWAWGLMSDLALCDKLSGTVKLYDIDKQAAKDNEAIGTLAGGGFSYQAVETMGEALAGADFVVLSILPGTFDEMQSDVHHPERYGIYQSVGDTTGPGGLIRGLRTVPMYVEFANAIKTYCPNAWVINYTNPMALCVATLYRVFPEIKAFGCCHEVFSSQRIMCEMLRIKGVADGVTRQDLYTNVVGINHFTWITNAHYKTIDLLSLYREYALEHAQDGLKRSDHIGMDIHFTSKERIKFYLTTRFGSIAAAGDRHLAEFCPGNWFLSNPEQVKEWDFHLTPVSARREGLEDRLLKSRQMLAGERPFTPKPTGEEGVEQMCALLGLGDMVTNVNLPNRGQIPNLPLGTVVETNAVFTGDTVTPVMAGEVPEPIYCLMAPAVHNQTTILNAALAKDANLAFTAFITDRLCDRLTLSDAKQLFNEMLSNTMEYLPGWAPLC